MQKIKQYDLNSIKAIRQNNTTTFTIKWKISNWCNYHCSYCIGRHTANNTNPKNTFKTKEYLLSAVDGINKIIDKIPTNKKIKLTLIGGEVSYYNIIEILENISRLSFVTIVTNFSNSLDYYKGLYTYLYTRNLGFNLVCSQHDENADYFDKIRLLTRWCVVNNYKVPQCRIMVGDDFDIDILKSKKLFNVEFNPSFIRDDNNKILPVSEELRQEIDKVYNKVSRSNLRVEFMDGSEDSYEYNAVGLLSHTKDGCFTPDGFICDAGVNAIYIDEIGDVLRAGCKYLKIYNREPLASIFNITDDFKLAEPQVCQLNKNNTDKVENCALCYGANIYRPDTDKAE